MRVELQYQPCHLLRGQGKENTITVSITDTHTTPYTHTHTKFQYLLYVGEEIHINTCVHTAALFLFFCLVLLLKMTSNPEVWTIKMDEKLHVCELVVNLSWF